MMPFNWRRLPNAPTLDLAALDVFSAVVFIFLLTAKVEGVKAICNEKTVKPLKAGISRSKLFN